MKIFSNKLIYVGIIIFIIVLIRILIKYTERNSYQKELSYTAQVMHWNSNKYETKKITSGLSAELNLIITNT
jgi:hypothetical protein